MSVIQRYRRIDLEITDENYYNSGEDHAFCDHSIHDAIPYAILDQLEEGELNNILNLKKPNRVITEGENTESWYNTEDWAITSSEESGKIAIGQTVSHIESKAVYGGVPLEVIQAWNFEERIRTVSSKAYDHVSGVYTVSVNQHKESVKELEEKVESEIQEDGSADIEAVICELDRSRPRQLGDAFSMLTGD